MTCERQEDVYIRPRYPVDEPPTYRAQCSCGWTGPERYRWITDSDWERHNREGGTVTEMSAAEAATVARFEAAEPAPESWGLGVDGGLREVLARTLLAATTDYGTGKANPDVDLFDFYADAVLALPEVATLRAKADAADRVRELAAIWADSDPDDANDDYGAGWDAAERQCAFDVRRALDGPDRTDRGRC